MIRNGKNYAKVNFYNNIISTNVFSRIRFISSHQIGCFHFVSLNNTISEPIEIKSRIPRNV